VAWESGAQAGLSLYLDDNLFTTLTGDTSSYKLDEVLLGPVMGQTVNAQGTLYFDEFTSSSLSGLSYNIFMPNVIK
jgi:hypothetical protein